MIDLSRNESPNPVSDRIRDEIAARISLIHQYPVEPGKQARAAAAECFGVATGNLVLTRGIDEAVDQLLWKYRDKRFFVITPGFDGFMERLRASGIACSSLVLDGEFRLTDTEIGKLDANSFVLLASPNNPTGGRFSESEIEAVFARCHGGLVDQTYEDFATTPLPRIADRPHLYRFRSFSKGFALAGLRLGALVGTAPDIETIAGRQPYCPIDTVSSQAILSATAGREFQENVDAIIRLRGELADQLRDSGFDILTGDTNFVLLRSDCPGELVAHLKARGILVKDTRTMGLSGYIRISVGTREDHAALIRALTSFSENRAKTDTKSAPISSRLGD